MLLRKFTSVLVGLTMALTLWAQSSDLISVNLKNASLQDFCSAIEKQTHYTFAYGEDILLPSSISISASGKALDEVLSSVLEPNNLAYRIVDRHIIIYKKRQRRAPSGSSPRRHTISGYIIDSSSRESLIGATAYSVDHAVGTVSNVYGFFSLSVPSDEATVNFSFLGFKPRNISFSLTNDTLVYIPLSADNRIDEVVVSAERPSTGVASTRMGSETIPVEMVRKAPSLLGESDVLRTLQVLPGTQKGVAGTSGVMVRGGGKEQNLYLLDGVPMYNVDHLCGFFSAFAPDIVKNVEFYKSSFPSRYGGRLSSVIDVRTKDGDMDSYHGVFSVGLISSHAAFEGPVVKGRTSFVITGRRSYTNLFKEIIDIGSNVNFYDINAKVNHVFSENDRLYASFYLGRDFLKTEDSNSYDFKMQFSDKDELVNVHSQSSFTTDLHWGNTVYNLRWNHVFSPRLFSNLTLAYDMFRYNSEITDSDRELYDGVLASVNSYTNGSKSGIDDMTAVIDFDYHPSPRRKVRTGAQYILHRFQPELAVSRLYTSSDSDTIDVSHRQGNDKTNGHEFDIYYEEDFSLGSRLQVIAGLRATAFVVDGKCYANVEPRLSASCRISDGWKAKGAYTLMHQYVHLLSVAPISMPTDLWVPVSSSIKPMSSDQFSLGLYCNAIPSWTFSAEAYYKNMRHILDYKDGALYTCSSDRWQDLISSGRGYSEGVEFMVSKSAGNTTGTASYTLSKTEHKFDRSVSGGRWFPFKYDRRHVFNILLQHKFSDKFDVCATWSYASGACATVARQRTTYAEPSTNTDSSNLFKRHNDYYSGRNNYRIEPSHQLDLSVNFNRKLRHCERTINVSVVNAYNHKNPDMVHVAREVVSGEESYFSSDEQEGVVYKSVLRKTTVVPIIPSLSYTIRF